MNLRDKIAVMVATDLHDGKSLANTILSLVAEEVGKLKMPTAFRYEIWNNAITDVLALLKGGEHDKG